MSTDLDLDESGGVYSLAEPTENTLTRVLNRFTVLFLSSRVDGRGSLFVNELESSRIKTNSDVISVFSLAASQIIVDMGERGEGIYPYRASLTDFTFLSPLTVELSFTLHTNAGNITDNVVVTAEDS